MASSQKNLRNTLTTILEGITPPSDTGRLYRKLTGSELLGGASGHRTFWFDPPKSATISDFAANRASVRYEFQVSVRLSTAGQSIDSVFSMVADEGALLMGSINLYSGAMPSGVEYYQVTGYSLAGTDSDDLILQLAISTVVQETDGG